jgi:MFS family permease
VANASPRLRPPADPLSSWTVVGLLWFCGFFNYADRLAVNAVFPLLEKEFGLSKTQLGWLGSAFMIVYALSAPLAGFVVDLVSRRVLVVLGLGFWSLVCAATGLARSFPMLIGFRAAEGLGESFYFPASMSLLADYHSPRTRSRAMGVHQTSVYAGTMGGTILAGVIGERYGWRSPFWILGLIGMAYAVLLSFRLVEPKREPGKDADLDAELGNTPPRLADNLARIVRSPAAVALLAVFAGANFVATAFMTWLPLFIFTKFGMSLTSASLTSSFFPLANLAGALCGGWLADVAARRSRGGRIKVQGLGLLVGAPFVLAAGWTGTVPTLLVALGGFGICKGLYDANIFATLYDVIDPQVRGTAAGLMNTVGWAGGSLAPMVIGLTADRFGLSMALGSISLIYVVAGLLSLTAATQMLPQPGTTKP